MLELPDWIYTTLTAFGDYVAPIILGIIGYLASVIWGAWRRQRSFFLKSISFGKRSFLRSFTPRTDRLNIVFGLISPKASALPYYMVEEGDVGALTSITALVTELYGHKNLKFVTDEDVTADLHNSKHILSMSGPIWNDVTEFYIGRVGSPVTFGLNEENNLKMVVNSRQGNRDEIESTYTSTGRPKICFGMLISAKIAFDGREQNVLVLGGNSNLSTYAGGLFLWKMHKDNEIVEVLKDYKLSRNRRWAIIYKVENWFEERNTADPRELAPMKPGLLRVSVDRVYTDGEFGDPFEYHINLPRRPSE